MADKTFEENMTRLEEIVTRLEKGDVPLSQSLSLFEEGTRLAAACRPNMQPDPGTEPVSGRVERAEPSGRSSGRSQNLPCESRSVSAGKGPRSHRNGRQVGNQSSLRGRLCPNRGAADRRTPAHDDRGIAPRIQRDRKLHLPIAGE